MLCTSCLLVIPYTQVKIYQEDPEGKSRESQFINNYEKHEYTSTCHKTYVILPVTIIKHHHESPL